mmetsp:Transcript_42077/g.136150  ORF Transcript_42077/g.136150 Transcript_42077/m.136150 type:complete len:386 (-) Transcript_42077:174-1331(-)
MAALAIPVEAPHVVFGTASVDKLLGSLPSRSLASFAKASPAHATVAFAAAACAGTAATLAAQNVARRSSRGQARRQGLRVCIALSAVQERVNENEVGTMSGTGVESMAEFQVFIEDTDCFIVVFYANYFRYFQRAAAMLGGEVAGIQPPLRSLSLVGVKSAKYAAPARLGDIVRVSTASASGESDAGDTKLWHCTQQACVGEQECASAETVYIDLSSLSGPPEALAPPPAPLGASDPSVLVLPIAAHVDELTGAPPAWLPPGSQCLGAIDALRFFERARTTSIGGAAGLEVLRASGVIVVVARIENFVFDIGAAASSSTAPELESRTKVVVKGRRVVFEQQVVDPLHERVLAWGSVTCVCVDVASQRLVSAPPELMAKMSQVVRI